MCVKSVNITILSIAPLKTIKLSFIVEHSANFTAGYCYLQERKPITYVKTNSATFASSEAL